jgi:beta-ribofuranosylaminobenzene 5'-phosphate synthase
LKGVRVTTAARLHLGFLDFNGDPGRRFGSIGLAIDAFETSVQLREVARFETLGEERQPGARLAPRIAEHLGLDTAKKPIIASAIPAHAGLGSGTQLTMAVASAFRRFAGLRLDLIGDGRLLDRGARSGAAVLFERGGLVVDAGRGPNTEIAPVAARETFPRTGGFF